MPNIVPIQKWTDFKAIVTNEAVSPVYWTNELYHYRVFFVRDGMVWDYNISHGSTEETDFVTNFKSTWQEA